MGLESRVMPAASRVRLPFLLLQRTQAVTRFSQLSSPPIERGMIWSVVSGSALATVPIAPHDIAPGKGNRAAIRLDVNPQPHHAGQLKGARNGMDESIFVVFHNFRLAAHDQYKGPPGMANMHWLKTVVQDQNMCVKHGSTAAVETFSSDLLEYDNVSQSTLINLSQLSRGRAQNRDV